jgi:ferritin-like metal-binding protein YciE
MRIVSLRDLYVAELQDLLDVEQHVVLELPALAAAATSSALKDLLNAHLEESRIHAERLELLLRKQAPADRGGPSEAIHGLLREAQRRIGDTERGDVLDAALIGLAQRIEHYEIAAYGCARTYARTLRDEEAARLLQQTLDEEAAADASLTRLAERGINQAAGEDLRPDADLQRARLRYLPIAQVPDFKYASYRIRNSAGQDLGTLEGLIIDARSGRPDYFVVDSGGWFIGQRYIVPINALQPDDRSNTLRTTLERKSIEAYPPFNPGAYLGPALTQADEEYCPPNWLLTGVWMTEASGFAAVPPRAKSDFAMPASTEPGTPEGYPENDLMVARGEPEGRGDAAQKNETEPRIERYPER